MKAILCCLIFAIAACRASDGAKFYIGGLFPSDAEDPDTRMALGQLPELAAKLAVRHVNEMKVLVAHNVSLEMISFSTACNKDAGIYAYLQLMQSLKRKSQSNSIVSTFSKDPLPYVVLGPACSEPSYFTATLTSRYLKDIQISYAARTPLLSDITKIPFFYRTVPSYSAYNCVIYAIMQHFDWLFLGVTHEDIPHFTRSLEDLNSLLTGNMNRKNEGRNKKTRERTTQESQAGVIVSLGLNSFLERSTNFTSDARVFVAMVPEERVTDMMCAAFRHGMTGELFQWILLGNYGNDWLDQMNNSHSTKIKIRLENGTETSGYCTYDELIQAVESAFILRHHVSPMENLSKNESFWRDFEEFVNETSEIEFQSRLATRVAPTYDAVWITAHGLRSMLDRGSSAIGNFSGSGISYTDQNSDQNTLVFQNLPPSGLPISQLTATLNSAIERTDFKGISGRIRFSPTNHDKLGQITYIFQVQSGSMVPIGIHNGTNRNLNLSYYGNEVKWQGTHPPRDRPVVIRKVFMLWMVCSMLVVATLGMVLVTSVIIVNCIYRKHKVIKASSPYLNFVIALGCALGFISVIFLSLDYSSRKISTRAYPFLCNVRPWLLSIGFTLAFGTIFVKMWRIYVIFRNPWTKKRPYKDHVLFGVVAALLIFDLITLILWRILSPLSLEKVKELDSGSFIENEYIYCVSLDSNRSNVPYFIWIGIIIFPKTILLLFGIFLVIQTRKIKAKFFRDSKFTGIAIFGFVMTCGVGVPGAFFSMFFLEPDLGYLMATGTIEICSFLILVMVFVPKFILLKKYKNKIPSALLVGLNPSFRIQKLRKVSNTAMPPRLTYYSRGASNSVLTHYHNRRRNSSSTYSSASSASSGSFSPSFNDINMNTVTRRNNSVVRNHRRKRFLKLDDWEPAFDLGEGQDLETQEVEVHFGDCKCITYMAIEASTHRASIDTIRSYDSRGSIITTMTDIDENAEDSAIEFVARQRDNSTSSTQQLTSTYSVILEGNEEEENDDDDSDEVETSDSMFPAIIVPMQQQEEEEENRVCDDKMPSRSPRRLTIVPSPIPPELI